MESTKVNQQAAGHRALVEKVITLRNAQALNHLGLVYILLALNALDVYTTHIGLQMGAVEANPVVAGLMGGIGEPATYAVKVAVVLAAALVLCRLGKPLALKWLNLGMAGIVISNLVILTSGFAA
jgi:hypothetical protein